MLFTQQAARHNGITLIPFILKENFLNLNFLQIRHTVQQERPTRWVSLILVKTCGLSVHPFRLELSNVSHCPHSVAVVVSPFGLQET